MAKSGKTGLETNRSCSERDADRRFEDRVFAVTRRLELLHVAIDDLVGVVADLLGVAVEGLFGLATLGQSLAELGIENTWAGEDAVLQPLELLCVGIEHQYESKRSDLGEGEG